MKSLPMRDPEKDHLLTPKNAALILIDYQPPQVYTVASIEQGQLINNVVALAKTAKLFDVPIVLSTVNVSTGVNPDTIPQLRNELSGLLSSFPSIDRTSINAWEDEEFLAAVKATKRQKLVIGALWTEACLLFPTLDALKEGYEVYPVTDAAGGTSPESHRAALERMSRAGAQPTTWLSLACELQRDWARMKTAKGFQQTIIEQSDSAGWYMAFEVARNK